MNKGKIGADDFLIDHSAEDFKQLPTVEPETISTGMEWEEPIPLDIYSSLPEFPIDALPEPGREMVKVVSEVNQVDPGVTASIYLSVLSVSLAKKAEVDLITHREPINIYTCSILDSGNRKSSLMGVMTKPVYAYQAEAQKVISMKIKEAMNAHKIREMRLANLQKEAAQGQTKRGGK